MATSSMKKGDKLQVTEDSDCDEPRRSYRVTQYQYLLLMLYALRAHRSYEKFSIATEVEGTGEFHDIVFRRPKGSNSKDGRLYQLVRIDIPSTSNQREITAKHLLNEENGPFSLRKYFQSYREMKNGPLIGSSDEIESLILCSNQEFEYGSKEVEMFEDTGTHDILQGKVLKFKKNFLGKEELVNHLMKKTHLGKERPANEPGIKNPEDMERASDQDLPAHVDEFLAKLRIAVSQPKMEDLEEIIKMEMSKCLRLEDPSNAFYKFRYEVSKWAYGNDSKYITEADVNRFFDILLGCIKFNLRDPVRNFTGRMEQLQQIHKCLHSESKRYIPRTVVVCGLGGIGKTELLRKYAKDSYKKSYNSIIWIDAEDGDDLQLQFRMLIKDLGIKNTDERHETMTWEKMVGKVYRHFEGRTVLMVVDNVNPTDQVKKFLMIPRDECMFMVLTSRSRDWSRVNILGLVNFSAEDAVDFIGLEIGSTADYSGDMARELAEKLSLFPLALKQAVSTIKYKDQVSRLTEERFSISDYLDLFEKEASKMLKYEFPSEIQNNYTNITYLTMNLAVSYAIKSDNAVFLLKIMSFMPPDNVDMKLLGSYFNRYHKLDVGPALTDLSNVSIVSIDGNRLSVHRLVQMINRDILRNTGQEDKVLEKCIRLLEYMDAEKS